ncbi:SDR family oxidoreductase [Herbiconiux ginsengi]|uniref:Dihydroflavonol-4-reductase n=1 Tax=Herbiconiux ginsengi TaxID=381665 RepID=A0A1H3LGT1_9MICO|nr:aldehyde reductase [Herbiconiux ginsengi]SDY63601.1 dihydroflavonol-4-reductase [Herbiconiux ginsengi]
MANVLVTGGSGFIASWCTLYLLDAGHDVRVTVRSTARGAALRGHLHSAADFDDSRLSIVEADLNGDSGWDDAVAEMDYVLHVASPTLREADITEAQMIAAARDGVLRVLRRARDAGVKRVVLTSAYGAVGYGHKPQEAPFTEEDWTDVDANIAPYQRSKTLAERAAWTFIAEEGDGLELAAVNPTTVIGPLVGPDDPPTLRMIRGMLDGVMPACPPFATGWVDVRDVADLHLRAMTDPAAAGERFLAISGHSLRIVDIAHLLRDRLGERAAKAPTRELPLFVARALSVVNPQLRALRPQLGQNFTATSAKAERLLGWHARPVADTVADTGESLLAHPGRDA